MPTIPQSDKSTTKWISFRVPVEFARRIKVAALDSTIQDVCFKAVGQFLDKLDRKAAHDRTV